MKKSYLLMLAIPSLLFSCGGRNIDTPKSPFDDHYNRIGMNCEYVIKNQLAEDEFDGIKESIKDKEDEPTNASHFKHQIETRDLKYAYFGQESSTISQCSMLSQIEDSNRYSNNVSIDINNAEQQTQTANAGVIKTNSTVTDFKFDTKYKESTLSNLYRQSRRTEKNDEPLKEEIIINDTPYNPDAPEIIFGLRPVSKIKSHFSVSGFELLGANVVCGTTADGKYVIREGYSKFRDFTTTMSRSYKAVDNYFYEGLLEKDTNSSNQEIYHFTNFRFYHELLILSKAFDGTGVPVLYLDKPVLIEYSEDKYSIEYEKLEPYKGDVPCYRIFSEK